jgi:hypothetical protein
MENETKYYIGLIPNSNLEFEYIEARLEELGVVYEKRDVYKKGPDCFSRAYRILFEESSKLPKCEGKPFLPVYDLESGHGLSLDVEGKIWKRCLDNENLEGIL